MSGSGTAAVTINFPRAGVYALDFRGAAELGPDLGNPLDFYFDDQRVTPHAQDLTVNPRAWVPGTGLGRDPSQFVAYGTVPVYVSGPGQHTFRIVGRGTAEQTTVIDDVRVASTDAIFASRLPGGGQAAGQVSRINYRLQLAAQARYAKPYGLKVVAYEGGWSLGGDTESVPIQSWAKYRDGRAAEAMAEAIDAFHQTGGELNVLGTYDQWYLDDSAHAADYPLVRGIDARIGALPAAATLKAPDMPPAPAAPWTPVLALPGGWFIETVGHPDLTGTAMFDGHQWIVQGAGRDSWRPVPDTGGADAGTAREWLKLEQHGDTVTGFSSVDGHEWTLLGEATTVPVALAAPSLDPVKLAPPSKLAIDR